MTHKQLADDLGLSTEDYGNQMGYYFKGHDENEDIQCDNCGDAHISNECEATCGRMDFA